MARAFELVRAPWVLGSALLLAGQVLMHAAGPPGRAVSSDLQGLSMERAEASAEPESGGGALSNASLDEASAGAPGSILPDSPGQVKASSVTGAEGPQGPASAAGLPASDGSDGPQKASVQAPPCPPASDANSSPPGSRSPPPSPCSQPENRYRRFLNTPAPEPLTWQQKGILATRNLSDPFGLLTIAGNSAFTIGTDAHTGYGPGLAGFGRNVGYSLLQDATGEFLGTFAVCSLFHQDPHYHRMPQARPMRRVLHALVRTFVSQHDDGTLMPNYENLIIYPASAELSNLYVPDVAGNGTSTVARILTGLATDPAGNLITEFLPDLARRVHVRILFVQQIINQVARGEQL